MVDLLIRSLVALAAVVVFFFFSERLGQGKTSDAQDHASESKAHDANDELR